MEVSCSICLLGIIAASPSSSSSLYIWNQGFSLLPDILVNCELASKYIGKLEDEGHDAKRTVKIKLSILPWKICFTSKRDFPSAPFQKKLRFATFSE